jgi:hypothetical protein
MYNMNHTSGMSSPFSGDDSGGGDDGGRGDSAKDAAGLRGVHNNRALESSTT